MKHHYTAIILVLILALSWSETRAQCFPDRHNTSLSSSWISCTTSVNPNTKRSSGHWILYDLGEMKTIDGLKLWNLSHPDHLQDGIYNFTIDYVDFNGVWKQHGNYNLDQGTTSAFYEGQDVDIDGDIVSTKVLITVQDNHGGSCSGFSEIRFNLRKTITATEDISDDHFRIDVAPNPFDDYTSIEISQLEGRVLNYQLINSLGQIALNETVKTSGNRARFGIDGKHLASGTYFLKIIDGEKVSVRKLSHQAK